MTERVRAGVLLLVGFSVLVLGVPLFFYWTVPEEWMATIVMSALFWVTSVWLTFFWALKVVFPFIKKAAESAVTEADRAVPIRAGGGTASRWALGVAIPLLIVSFDVLALLYYPLGWVGVLITGACVVVLVYALRYYFFFRVRIV